MAAPAFTCSASASSWPHDRKRTTQSAGEPVLEIGTAILFGSLAPYALLGRPAWSVIGVRLAVDAGLLLIVLASMVLGRPFTLQYAREQVASEHTGTHRSSSAPTT